MNSKPMLTVRVSLTHRIIAHHSRAPASIINKHFRNHSVGSHCHRVEVKEAVNKQTPPHYGWPVTEKCLSANSAHTLVHCMSQQPHSSAKHVSTLGL